MMLLSMNVAAAVVAIIAFTGSNAIADEFAQGRSAFEAGQYENARTKFKAAAEQGNLNAKFNLARMYELGLGGERTLDEAIELYELAASKGDAASRNRLGLYFYRGENGAPPNYQKAHELFKAAADSGDMNAAYNLGQLYMKGNGVASDEAKALALFEQAAAKDHILALNTLGAFYKTRASEKAHAYFARSASYGNTLGLYEIALFGLHEKQGRDALVSAHMYLNLASARGLEQATLSLQELSKAMRPEDIALAQAKAREFKAISHELRD